MKKTVIIIAAALGLAVLIAVLAAPSAKSSEASLSTRIRALEVKVRSLQRTVAATTNFVACIRSVGPVGVSQFGGYVYSNDNGATHIFTTALDADNDNPHAWVPTVNPACVVQTAGMFAHGPRNLRAQRAQR